MPQQPKRLAAARTKMRDPKMANVSDGRSLGKTLSDTYQESSIKGVNRVASVGRYKDLDWFASVPILTQRKLKHLA
jgi:hypothetical protein